jgi:hypothetical protein
MTNAALPPLESRTVIVERVGLQMRWSAVLAGVVVAMALQVSLYVLGVAIGLAAWDSVGSVRSVGLGAAAWFFASILLSLFVGGMTASHVAGVSRRSEGVLHGVVVWGMALLVASWFFMTGARAMFIAAADLPDARVATESRPRATSLDSPTTAGASSLSRKVDSTVDATKRNLAAGIDSLAQSGGEVAHNATHTVAGAAWVILLAEALALIAAVGGAAVGLPRYRATEV